MSFDSAANNLVKIPIASAHTSGATSLVLGVSGTSFPTAPFRITAITGATYGTSSESLTIHGVTAVAINTPTSGQCTLTVSAIEGTSDQNYGTSDFAEMRLTAGTISDLNTAAAKIIPGGPGNLTVGTSGQLNFGSQSAPGSPSVGDEWYDSTQLCRAYYDGPGGLAVYGSGLIFSQVTNVTVTASGSSSLVSATSAVGTVSLPAGFLNVVGRTLRIRARLYGSTGATGSGSVFFFLKLGSNVVATTASGQTLTSSVTTAGLALDVDLTTKATGTSGKLDAGGAVGATQGKFFASINAVAMQNGTAAGTQTPGTQVTLDLTQAYALDFQVNWTTSANSITLTNLTTEVLA